MNKKKLYIDFIITIFFLGAVAFFVDSAYASQIDYQVRKIIPDKCDYMVSSGLRTKKKNADVGGAPGSYHLTDRARDLVLFTEQCKDRAIENTKKSSLSVIVYKTHLHIDNRKDKVCLIRTKTGFGFCAGEPLDIKLEFILDF